MGDPGNIWPPSTAGRTAVGTFAPGNSFAKGNPQARRMKELRAVVLNAITGERLEAIVQTLATQAQAGDVPSAKLLFEYALGKPTQAVEVIGADGESLTFTVNQVRAVVLEAVGEDPDTRARAALAFRQLSGPIAGDVVIDVTEATAAAVAATQGESGATDDADAPPILVGGLGDPGDPLDGEDDPLS